MPFALPESLLLAATVLLAGCGSEPDTVAPELLACAVTVDGSWSETSDGAWDTRQNRIFNEAGQLVRNEHHAMSEIPGASSEGYFAGYTDYFYDSEGRQIRKEEWTVGKLEPSDYTTYTYDEEGRLLSVRSDFSSRGISSTNTEYRYGEFGLTLMIEFNTFGVTRSEYGYNDEGLRNTIDIFVDGTLQTTVLASYDDQQRVVVVLRDHVGASPYRSLEYREYNESGDQVAALADNDADGAIDSSTTYEYDSAGHKIREDTDCDMDGVIDWTNHYVYDEEGRLVYGSKQVEDHGSVMTIETTYDYACHDTQGNQRRQVILVSYRTLDCAASKGAMPTRCSRPAPLSTLRKRS